MKRASDRFVQAYVTCALWSSSDNSRDDGGDPLDRNYGPEDIAKATLRAMREDCDSFVRANAADLAGIDDEQAGHDFWLTRNGHGAGFWDRGLGDVGDRLSDAARAYGSFDLYVSRGKVYGQ